MVGLFIPAPFAGNDDMELDGRLRRVLVRGCDFDRKVVRRGNCKSISVFRHGHGRTPRGQTHRVHYRPRPCTCLLASSLTSQKKDELEYWLTEHLRLNGVYWGLTATCLLGCPQTLNREEMIRYVQSCQTEEGLPNKDWG
jgi:hypothetical protein